MSATPHICAPVRRVRACHMDGAFARACMWVCARLCVGLCLHGCFLSPANAERLSVLVGLAQG